MSSTGIGRNDLRDKTKDQNGAVSQNVYKSLSTFPSINWFEITLAVAERACALGARTGIKGGDAIVLQVAEEYGIPLLTKDKEMRGKAPASIVIFEPKDVPV